MQKKKSKGNSIFRRYQLEELDHRGSIGLLMSLVPKAEAIFADKYAT